MKLYNSLTRQKDEFTPLEPGVVRMYSCGPTVYNYFHIGNARPFIVFDALRRYFEYLDNRVIFVQNFTDVDDKMINKARDEGISVKELGERFINEYKKDAHRLGIGDPTHAPKATDTIPEIIEFVQTLVEKGYAYNIDGNVYFSTKKFSEYGKLSHQPLDELEAGARVEALEEKHDTMDFALWKKQKTDDEIAWKSPWGMGRPGWHIECSAMAKKFLGEQIDIHSGGQDLIFPHHENEVAQSEAANGCEFARFWLHNGYINIDNRKMSKSLGNFFTVREILDSGIKPEVIRFFMLSSHYRSPINFSFDILKQAESGLERITTCITNLEFLQKNGQNGNAELGFDGYKNEFLTALDDDFNTALAISVIFNLVKDVNTVASEASSQTINGVLSLLRELCGVLNILAEPVAGENLNETALGETVDILISQRDAARASKNWEEADRIRDELVAMGFEVKDTPNGTQVV